MAHVAWHYTTGDCLDLIQRSRILRREAPLIEGVRTAVWFTLSETFAPTARKGIVEHGIRRTATIEEMVTLAGGLARIGVDASRVPLTWEDYRRKSGASRRLLRDLEKTARFAGDDPSSWRVAFHDLYPAEWIAIERWTATCWR